MKQLHEIIKAIQDAPTKGGGKKAVLLAHRDDDLLRQFLKAVYDPRIQYGITKVPKVIPNCIDQFDESVLVDLMKLADRELTGKKATQFLADLSASMDPDGQRLLEYVIGRDIRAGVGEGSVLEAFPGLFYIPPYQRCASMTPERKERFGQMPWFYVQSKSDGQFCYAIKRRTCISESHKQAMSRAGSLYPGWLANHITYGMPEGYVAMGELLVVRDGKVMSRKDGNGVLNSVLSGDGSKFKDTDSVRFIAWDMVTEEEFDAGESVREYRERWTELSATSLERTPSWAVKSVKEANKLQAEHVARGEEGTVWKNPQMGWRDCSSGDKDMMKAKIVFEAEYRVRAIFEGEGKYAGMMGGMHLETSDGLIQFDVGSGFSDKQRLEFWRDGVPEGTVVTCEGNDIVTSKGKTTESVFLPIFVEIRLDKKVADSRDRVWEQLNAAKEGKS